MRHILGLRKIKEEGTIVLEDLKNNKKAVIKQIHVTFKCSLISFLENFDARINQAAKLLSDSSISKLKRLLLVQQYLEKIRDCKGTS